MSKKHSALRYVWERVTAGANKRGIECALTKAQVWALVSLPCVYCGSLPQTLNETPKHQQVTRNGIDRIDSSIGYVLANVAPCCKRCNWAKHDDTLEEFLEWLAQIRGWAPEESLDERLAKVREELLQTEKWQAVIDGQPKASRSKPVWDSLGNRFASTQAAADKHGYLRTEIVAFLRGWRKMPEGISFWYEDPAANDNANRPVAKNQPGKKPPV